MQTSWSFCSNSCFDWDRLRVFTQSIYAISRYTIRNWFQCLLAFAAAYLFRLGLLLNFLASLG